MLEDHTHPDPTMVIVCKGTGKVTGAVDAEVREGDIVAIPANEVHGFVGTGNGFVALSLQFTGTGLYEDVENAKVTFSISPVLSELKRENEHRIVSYIQIPFFDLLTDGALSDEQSCRRFKGLLKLWSKDFQRLLFFRMATTIDPDHLAIAKDHFKEEFEHDELIHSQLEPEWDAVLNACFSWFRQAFINGTDSEKAVLMHLVLECAADEFHSRAVEAQDVSEDAKYFEVHALHDSDHAELADKVLERVPEAELPGLINVLNQGWDVLELMLNRISELVREQA